MKFDIEQDTAIVNAGGFFCRACLVGKPANEQSPDHRYCQGCYDFLNGEAAILREAGNMHRYPWVPLDGDKKTVQVVQDVAVNLSTLNGKKIEVDKLEAMTPNKPGPRPTELPDDFIRQLASQGLGSKSIARRLEKEYRVVVSYKTVQRRLQAALI